MWFLDWYFGLRPLIRFLVALVPLGIAGIMLAAGRFWPLGWGLGAILLCCSLPGRSEKNKWGDW
jgi:hypothetical protein